MFINTNIEIFLSSIAFNRSSVRDRRAVSVEWCLRLPVWNCDGLLLLSKNVTNCLWTNLSFTLDNTGNSDMGRLLHGFPASPSLGTQVTSAIFQTRANVLDLKEMFISGGGGAGGLLRPPSAETSQPERSIVYSSLNYCHVWILNHDPLL